MSIGMPGFTNPNRRTVRAESNPLDKTTIVSVYPVAIRERKETITPGVFELAAGSYEKPAILVVGPSSWWREIDENQPLLEIVNSSVQIADSVVKDFANGLTECNMNDCMPGLFYIPGCKTDKDGKVNNELTLTWIKTEYKKSLDNAKLKQENWYRALIKLADTLWARTNGNPSAISNDMRIAAEALGMKDKKSWMGDFSHAELIPCKACSTLVKNNVIVCPNCKVVLDQEKFKSLGLTFA